MALLFCPISKRTLREISSAATAAAFWRSERKENCKNPHPPADGFGSCGSGATSSSSFCLLSDCVLSSIFFFFCEDSNERDFRELVKECERCCEIVVPYAMVFRSVVCYVVLDLGGRCNCVSKAMPNVVFKFLSVWTTK